MTTKEIKMLMFGIGLVAAILNKGSMQKPKVELVGDNDKDFGALFKRVRIRRLEAYREQLAKEERYEEAARVRDEIKRITS